jgi:hypothetical protein
MIAQRIKTGFHRAGVFIAALIAIPGVLSLWSWVQWKSVEPSQAAIFFIAAIAAYAFIRGVGWVVAGFAGDA